MTNFIFFTCFYNDMFFFFFLFQLQLTFNSTLDEFQLYNVVDNSIIYKEIPWRVWCPPGPSKLLQC